MKKLRKIKKKFDTKDLNKYKNKFRNRQIRFAFSKVALIFKYDIDLKTLFRGEELILLNEKNERMYVKSFKILESKIDGNIDWETFGRLMWYSFQTSTYWKDRKKNTKNIFTKENFIDRNEEKRSLYYIWLNSIPKNIDNYNIKISKTLKVIF